MNVIGHNNKTKNQNPIISNTKPQTINNDVFVLVILQQMFPLKNCGGIKNNWIDVFHIEMQYSAPPKKLAGENTSQGHRVLSWLYHKNWNTDNGGIAFFSVLVKMLPDLKNKKG